MEKRMAKGFRAAGRRFGIMRELLSFLWERKLWWMLPMVSMLLMLGILLVFAQSSAIAPFIYTLF
jgi:hypothetical protein